MFSLWLAFILSSVSTSNSLAEEISVIAGVPDLSVAGLEEMVTTRIDLTGAAHETYVTTGLFSILHQSGTKSSAAFEILGENGSASLSSYVTALRFGATLSPVVYSALGPLGEESCQIMAKNPDTAFVVAAGNDARELNRKELEACNRLHILIVAAYDQEAGQIEPYSNWGLLVGLAANGHRIQTTTRGGELQSFYGTSVAAALAAGSLVQYHREHETLKGADLVDHFLMDRTMFRPQLARNVAFGRLLSK